MKKVFKPIVSLMIAVLIIASVFSFNVSAASVAIGGAKEYNVGQKVSISIKFTADATLYAVEVDASYNSSVLRLDSVSGAEYNAAGGNIKIVDDNFNASKPSKTSSYTLNFTAIAAGNSNITVNVLGGGEAESKASGSAAVTVVTPKPSSNANLGSITVDGVKLSPAFNASTTSYSATVKYSVANVNIKGSVADGGATYVGGGSWDLKVGDNSRTLTVTAADGTKKAYTVNIKRMTEEETAAAEEDARNANPLLVVIDGVDYTIVNDFTDAVIPSGFTLGTAIRKESEVSVLNDDKGEYQLYCLADAEGKTAFYTRNENDVFARISYINVGGKMYIIEELDLESVPEGFVKATRTVDGIDIKAYNYVDENLKDFYIVKCYINGSRAYYSVDTAEGTIQRAVQFEMSTKTDSDNVINDETDGGLFAWFTSMNKTGKIVFCIIVVVGILLITLAVVLIVKIASSGKAKDIDEYDEGIIAIEQSSEFILQDDTYDETSDEPQE